jgi:pyruvate kinase
MASYADIDQLSAQLEAIRERAGVLESKYAKELSSVHPEFREGARNLVHYLALRESNTHELRNDLRRLGLSSLAHAERNVLASVAAVHRALEHLAGRGDSDTGGLASLLQRRNPTADAHRQAILGARPEGRDVSIMVTLPSEAADNPMLVSEMIAAGMNIARINCAHDDADVWTRMISNVHEAADDASTECRIIMDLAGPPWAALLHRVVFA